jgi:hypothetical protein
VDHPKYINKNGTPDPRYICDKCLAQRGDLVVFSTRSFIGVTCCVCGTVGTHTRLTNTSAEKVTNPA